MNFSTKNFWSRATNRIYTAISTKIREKTYGEDENRVKYMLFPRKNNCKGKNILAVCFPAFAGMGAKYNYVRTLRAFNIHKLFLLDDIGGTDKGNYLIKRGVEENVKGLIQQMIDRYHPEKIIFFGSSKGGYTSINYALEFKNVKVCIAAPQYFLADYLIKEKKFDNLKTILGEEVSDKTTAFLNNRLRNKIMISEILPDKVYIHYSNKEHTYKEHIEDMLADLKKVGIEVSEDIGNYTNHMDLVYYFPNYLKATITEIITE